MYFHTSGFPSWLRSNTATFFPASSHAPVSTAGTRRSSVAPPPVTVLGVSTSFLAPPHATPAPTSMTKNPNKAKRMPNRSPPRFPAQEPGTLGFSCIVTYGNRTLRRKISTTIYITPEQDERLKQLHQKTKVPVAEYIRQGIDLILDRYKDELPGQVDLFRERK